MISPTVGNIRWDTDTHEWIIRGERVKTLVGRTSFDWATNVSHHYTGQGGFPGAGLGVADKWIEHNQELFGREDVVLAVFNEEGDWSPCSGDPPTCMFGQVPRDQRLNKNGDLVGIWDIEHLRELSRRGERVRDLTALNKNMIEYAFQKSHETGCIFDWVVDATLKHTDGISNDLISHVIRQTAAFMRAMQALYPNAAFFFRTRNEWNAHDNITVDEVNLWATRFYRWKNVTSGITRQSFKSPGAAFEAEQWPEGFCIVDPGGGNFFTYDVGPEPGKYKAGAFHQDRHRGRPGDTWIDPITPDELDRMRRDARGMPLMNTENMYMVSLAGSEGWYRGPDGWNNDIDKQIRFYSNNVPLVPYFCVHDDIGKKANADWNTTPKGKRWEDALREFFGGNAPGPGPDPEPTLLYARIINQAYDSILGRVADPGGLAHYNQQMLEGRTEASVREELIRSQEYENKNKNRG